MSTIPGNVYNSFKYMIPTLGNALLNESVPEDITPQQQQQSKESEELLTLRDTVDPLTNLFL